LPVIEGNCREFTNETPLESGGESRILSAETAWPRTVIN
jgi:hypothetical protein